MPILIYFKIRLKHMYISHDQNISETLFFPLSVLLLTTEFSKRIFDTRKNKKTSIILRWKFYARLISSAYLMAAVCDVFRACFRFYRNFTVLNILHQVFPNRERTFCSFVFFYFNFNLEQSALINRINRKPTRSCHVRCSHICMYACTYVWIYSLGLMRFRTAQ